MANSHVIVNDITSTYSSFYHSLHKKMPVPSQEHDSCYQFV